MRRILVEPARLESCAQVVEQQMQQVQRTVAQLYERVDEMSLAWQGKDNQAFSVQIKGYQDDFRQIQILMMQYSEFLRSSARSYRQMQEELAAQATRLVN